MPPSRRLLKGMIAGNPGNYTGLGEWRYCYDCGEAFFAREGEPDAGHSEHRWRALPALDPEGQERLAKLFRRFMQGVFSAERQAELTAFARRQGWDMAYEHRAGGGALTAEEVERWREVVEADLERLVDRAERMMVEQKHA
ncbi:MAG: hypothetical protein JXA37_02250 [Chloroflexia bacterium]|nr:hypothetical protein [Chloroflexia bacterium]